VEKYEGIRMKFESLEIDGVLYNLTEVEKSGKNYGLLIIFKIGRAHV
jgi:hypothetical protein